MAEEEIASAAEAGAAAEAVVPFPPDNKRKKEDLERDDAMNPDILAETPPAELKELKATSNGVYEQDEDAHEVALDAPELKRPRLEEETDASVADTSQQEIQKEEVPQAVHFQHPHMENDLKPVIGVPEEGNVPAENIQQPASDIPEEGNVPTNDIQQPASGVSEQGNAPTDNIQQSASGDPLQGDLPKDNTLQQPMLGVLQQDNIQQPAFGVLQQGNLPPSQPPKLDSSRKIEIPNDKVGVLIGKGGDTIKFLQINSGARIQITRDVDADPNSSTRPVELIGTPENTNKAEQLIKDVIAEADAGGSPSLVARGFNSAQTGAEEIQIQVPYEKVGLIIGKGGETIKSLQTKSGARIQVMLQDIPEDDLSKERMVRITGNKKQIETAREMVKEVLNKNPARPSPLSGGYKQPAYRPRGPTGPPHWGPRVPPPAQPYQQGGMYSSQTPQYPPQTYSGYPQHQAPRSGFNAGWEQRTSAPMLTPPQSESYYGQGGHSTDGPAPSAHVPTASAAAPTSTQANYNYGQPQGYGQPTHPQSMPPQQSYGHGYNDPKYDSQALTQIGYGNTQSGAYPQQVSTDRGYVQQQYKQPTYGPPSKGPPPQSFGPPPRATQPGDVPYQGSVPSSQMYGPQQSYPYASSGQTQQSYPYGPTPVTNDGYTQTSSVAAPTPGYAPQGGPVAAGYAHGGQVAPGYAPQGQPAPVYAQQGGQPAPVYAQQGGQPSGYGQYPPSQQGYIDQSAPNSTNYGYQASTDASFNTVPGQAYNAPPSGQAGYVQSVPPAGYESGQMYGHN